MSRRRPAPAGGGAAARFAAARRIAVTRGGGGLRRRGGDGDRLVVVREGDQVRGLGGGDGKRAGDLDLADLGGRGVDGQQQLHRLARGHIRQELGYVGPGDRSVDRLDQLPVDP